MPDGFLSSEEYDEQAHKLYNDGDYDGALEMLKEGLSLYPNAVELYVGLGYARLAREEFAWARHAFDRAILLDPTHEDAQVGLGEVLLRFGQEVGFEPAREDAQAIGPDYLTAREDGTAALYDRVRRKVLILPRSGADGP